MALNRGVELIFSILRYRLVVNVRLWYALCNTKDRNATISPILLLFSVAFDSNTGVAISELIVYLTLYNSFA